MSADARKKIGDASRGENNAAWKGDGASYSAIHNWLSRWMPLTGRCSRCGESGRITHRANLSGEYKRDLNDFAEMCVPCHKNHDLQRQAAP